MSASQLLRILQTLPVGADDEICAFNTAELEANMNRSSKSRNPFLSNEENNLDLEIWNTPELETSVFSNDYTNNHEHETLKKSTPLCNGFYIDKHSVESELPELIVCYKESDFQVKHICIDEEIVPIDNIKLNRNDDEMIETNLDTEFLKHEWLSPSTMTGCRIDVGLKSSTGSSTLQIATNNYGLNSPIQTCEKETNLSDKLQDDVSANKLASNSMLSLQNNFGQQPLQGYEEANSERPNVQMKNKINENDSIYELPLETESENTGSGKVAVIDDERRYVEGESSFSMAGVISELISCSRPMPFAAGVSSRSDSSATSTRSFAFPTLETEYISSPVRMGKTERRRLQKHRGWRQGLLCCKF